MKSSIQRQQSSQRARGRLHAEQRQPVGRKLDAESVTYLTYLPGESVQQASLLLLSLSAFFLDSEAVLLCLCRTQSGGELKQGDKGTASGCSKRKLEEAAKQHGVEWLGGGGSAADWKMLLSTFFSASLCRPDVLDGGTLTRGWKGALGVAEPMRAHPDSLA